MFKLEMEMSAEVIPDYTWSPYGQSELKNGDVDLGQTRASFGNVDGVR